MMTAINQIRRPLLCFLCLFVACIPARAQQAKHFVDEGLAAFDRGDTTAARAAFEKALNLKADEVTAHTYLGHHRGPGREFERGRTTFRGCRQSRP